MGEYFAQKQAHMVTCLGDVFQEWVNIIKDVEQGKLLGRKPNQTHFRCLIGLEGTNTRKVQSKIKFELIVLSNDATTKEKVNLVS